MSEMTATHRGRNPNGGWVVAALLLWHTEVPGGLDVHATLAPFAALDLACRAPRLGAAPARTRCAGRGTRGTRAALSRVRPPLRGPALLRAAEVGVFAAAALLVARLPFGLATLWWQRRYGDRRARLRHGSSTSSGRSSCARRCSGSRVPPACGSRDGSGGAGGSRPRRCSSWSASP